MARLFLQIGGYTDSIVKHAMNHQTILVLSGQ